MKRAVVIDFDGTITKEEVSYSIVQKFAEGNWQEWEDMWIDNKITTPMLAEAEWNMLRGSQEEIIEYIKGFEINEGFKELYEYLKEVNYRLIITSEGFDYYIDPILQKWGYADVEVISSHLEYNDGWNFKYPYASKTCEQCGNCKKEVVERLRLEGYKVYFIGDGFSDRCASRVADVVFAKSNLEKYCRDNGIEYTRFDDFRQVLDKLKEQI